MDTQFETIRGIVEGEGYFTTDWDEPPVLICAAVRNLRGQLSGNSFKVFFSAGLWYLETWAPVTYKVPKSENADVVASICLELLGGSARIKRIRGTMAGIPDDIIMKYGLEIVPDGLEIVPD
jgi:hypothetical protein